MSKISAMQAQALGLKPANAKKPVAVKPAVAKPVAAKPSPAKPAAAKKAPAKKPAAKKVTPMKTAATAVKPAATPTKALVAKKSAPKKTAAKKPTKTTAKKAKTEKVKMERDSFTMPKDEYAQITLMKARLIAMGQPAKKSELLRAGIKLLAAMSDNTLKTTLAKIPVIKTGRPNKKG
jgi:hypothetical protein